MIQVVNKKNYKGDGVYVGRPSLLGNPFSPLAVSMADHRTESRDEAIEKYRDWLREQLKTDNAVSREFKNLVKFYRDFGELTLICWCVPKHRCHAQVIKEFIEEWIGEEP